MLLRRVKHHVSNENWFAVLVDFMIVVVGVYVGIEVSNLNEQRQESEIAVAYLERIKAELEQDLLTIDDREKFWSQVVEYGEAAVGHAETGVLVEGSVARTVLAYYQASQVAPFAAVSTTYEELKGSGFMRLIDDEQLLSGLAEYYVNATSVQSQHLLQYVPQYREYVRGLVPRGIQQYIWANCWETRDHAQHLIDCDLPVDDEAGATLLMQISGDTTAIRGLRFWTTNLTLARLVLADNVVQIQQLVDLIDELLGDRE